MEVSSIVNKSFTLVERSRSQITENMARAYETLVVEYVSKHVVEVRMNRPERRNAMNAQLWMEVRALFSSQFGTEASIAKAKAVFL
jgi:1,4-dihydroxy-2-naphthoyl-CoA synthase